MIGFTTFLIYKTTFLDGHPGTTPHAKLWTMGTWASLDWRFWCLFLSSFIEVLHSNTIKSVKMHHDSHEWQEISLFFPSFIPIDFHPLYLCRWRTHNKRSRDRYSLLARPLVGLHISHTPFLVQNRHSPLGSGHFNHLLLNSVLCLY